MTSRKYFAAGLGFAFIAAWVAFGFGDAVLCLLGAGLFYAIVSVLEGNVDLAELQDRFRGDSGSSGSSGGSTMRRGSRPRVQ
jgi:hypothetical protein